jgi:putative protease
LPELEIECFIHGAMCAGVSGRCVLSNVFTNRDANRGGCAQICRWDFDLVNEKDLALKGEKPFTFCSKDLSMLEYLPTMIDLGICSFKIEGRMRSIYYIATVLFIYRKVIDEYCDHKESYTYNKTYEKVLRNCANRDSVVQFIDGRNDELMGYYNGREEISNQDFLGVILEYDKKTKYALVEERNYFENGDEIEIFGPKTNIISQKIEEILDENKEPIEVVRHPKQQVYIKIEQKVNPKDFIRKKLL